MITKGETVGHNPGACPSCGRTNVTTRWENDTFPYGSGASAVELRARSVRVCASCGFEYADAAAEEARHEAVCGHLGILAPRQVFGIRQFYGMTRAEFAGVTRFGEASLARWETGALTQNPANDQLLYLLQFPENVERLKTRATKHVVTEHPPARQSLPARRFATLPNPEEKRIEAQSFTLHKSNAAA